MIDKPRLFIVDTGGVYSQMYASDAKELKLEPSEDKRYSEIGVNGDIQDQIVHVPEIEMGHVAFARATFVVQQDARPLPLADNEIAGTLAPSYLATFDLDFDFGHSRLNLFSPYHCPGKVVYWATRYVSVPFQFNEGHITFAMTLDGKPVTAVLDTGAPVTAISQPVAKSLFGIEPNSSGVTKVGHLYGQMDDNAQIYERRFDSLSIDGVEIKNPAIVLLPDKVSKRTLGDRELPQLILGLRELTALHLYIAYDEKKLYVTAFDAVHDKPVESNPTGSSPQ